MDMVPADSPGPDHGDKFSLQLELTFAEGDDPQGARNLSGLEPALSDVCANYDATLTSFHRDGHNLQLTIDCTPAVPLTKMVRTLRHVANRDRRRQRRGSDGLFGRIGRWRRR